MSAKSLLRQASASPLCLMNPARAIILLAPVAFPFSSHCTDNTCVNNGAGQDHSNSVRSRFGALRSAKGTYSGDLDLDGGVVLGSNESVGGGAFTGNVKFHDPLLVVLHLWLACFKMIDY